jgi:hypothetical protein
VGVEKPERFTNTVARYATLVLGALFGLLAVAGLFDERPDGMSKPFAAVLLGAGVWFAYRGFRGSTVIVGADRVVTRSFLRTRTYRPADLAGAHAVVGTTGGYGQQRQHLVLDLADGSVRRFPELNASPRRAAEAETIVDRAAAAIAAVACPPRDDLGRDLAV